LPRRDKDRLEQRQIVKVQARETLRSPWKARRRLVALASPAALALTFAFFLGPGILCCDQTEDVKKKEKIESMYNEYKRLSFPGVIDVDPRLAMDLAKRHAVVFVDVRTPEEQRVSMIPGAVTEEDFLGNLDKYKDDILIGYCTVSYRSGKLARRLKEEKGLTMYNLRGGLLAWVHDGGKLVDPKGETKRIHVYGRKWNLAPDSFESTW
jgi:rhodanese-related sulfurtransferase